MLASLRRAGAPSPRSCSTARTSPGGAPSRPAAPTATPTCIDRRPPFPLPTHTAGALSVRSDEDLLEEAAHALVAGAVEDGLRRAGLEGFALVPEDDAVGPP